MRLNLKFHLFITYCTILHNVHVTQKHRRKTNNSTELHCYAGEVLFYNNLDLINSIISSSSLSYMC